MKYKNRGFSLIESLIVILIIAILATMAIHLFKDKKNAEQRQITQSTFSPNSEIAVKEQGMYDYKRYFIFEDKVTKTRIFYFDKSMVVIPNKEGM